MAIYESDIMENMNNFSAQISNEKYSLDMSTEDDCAEYGLPLKDVYKLGYNFYKGKNHLLPVTNSVTSIFFRKGR